MGLFGPLFGRVVSLAPNQARLPRGMATGLLIKVLILMYQTTVQVDNGGTTGNVQQNEYNNFEGWRHLASFFFSRPLILAAMSDLRSGV